MKANLTKGVLLDGKLFQPGEHELTQKQAEGAKKLDAIASKKTGGQQGNQGGKKGGQGSQEGGQQGNAGGSQEGGEGGQEGGEGDQGGSQE